MQSFVVMLLICSVTMSALALFYMAITPFLAKRYSEKGCYYAWMIIVIGLIIPFRPQFNHAIVKVDIPREMAAAVVQITPDVYVNAAPAPAFPAISIWQAAVFVWLAGMTISLSYHVIKHYCFVKTVKRWSKHISDGQPFTLLQSLKSEMGISKQIGLYRCSSIGSPMMIGFIKPRILLSRADLSHDELRFILKHELIHYKRKDLYYKCLVLLATAIHWFNPIIYLMAQEIGVQCESSCDVETIQGSDADTRQRYSETIIGVAKYRSKLETALSTNFYGGKKDMKKRISSIMDTNKKKMGITILCGALIFTLGAAMVFAASTGSNRTESDAASFRAGDIVAVQIIAEAVSDLNAYEFSLCYDDTAFQAKSIYSAIDTLWVGAGSIDAGLTVSGVPNRDDSGNVMKEGKINGKNMVICEFVMEVMKDGQARDLSIQDLFVWDSSGNLMENPSGWDFKVVSVSEDQSLILEGMETNLYEPKDTGGTVDSGEPLTQEPESGPGQLNGVDSGRLRVNAEKQEVSSGESVWVEVFLNEPAESNVAALTFWFDPDELKYQGFDEAEGLYISSETVDQEAGTASLTFTTAKDIQSSLIGSLGTFHFVASEDSQPSGRQCSLSIAADYVVKEGDEKIIRSQSAGISFSVR